MPDLSMIETEIYNHEYLWGSASKLLEYAEARNEEKFHFLLPLFSAAVFSVQERSDIFS